MNRIGTSAIAIIGVFLLTGCKLHWPLAEVTVEVVDEEGLPLADAVAWVGGSYGSVHVPVRKGRTDRNGRFRASVRSDSTLTLIAEKEGFHPVNRFYYEFMGGKQNGRWQPRNPTVKVQLRKKGIAVPMVADYLHKDIPAVNQPLGYDLLLCDWVKPYGRGEAVDFIIELVRSEEDVRAKEDRIRLSFSNPDDGLIQVRQRYGDDYGLWLPAMAPEHGYIGRWEFGYSNNTNPPSAGWTPAFLNDRDNNFFLRVRSHRGSNGQIISALYGKIYWGLKTGLSFTPDKDYLELLYFLNPDGTRNTEYDVKRNLYSGPTAFRGRP